MSELPKIRSRGRVLIDSTGAEIGNSTTPLTAKVAGDVAHDAVDSGNPVKIGGKAKLAAPAAVSDLDRVDLWLGRPGNTVMGAVAAVAADGYSNGLAYVPDTTDGTLRLFAIMNHLHNGTTNDEQRGNFDTAALITAAGATTTQTSADQTNYNGRGVQVVLDMTVVGTGSVTITIQGKDAASGKYYTLLAGAAVVTNSTNLYTVYPGAPTTANVSASLPLPRVWRVVVTANNANATTYKVGASVIL